jgi:hypothetical protein
VSIPLHDAAERQNIAWVLRFSPGIAGDADKLRRLRMSRFSRLAAFTYPRVGQEELALVCNWITWLFFHDDCWCDDSDVGEAELARFHQHMLGVLRGEAPRHADSSLLHMLADLRRRMLVWADDEWMARFTGDVDRYLQSNRWEAHNRRHAVTPPLAAYVKMRRFTGAMDTVFDCIELVEHLHLSKAVREHTTVSRLRLMANNCVCWANDLFSVDKELLEHNHAQPGVRAAPRVRADPGGGDGAGRDDARRGDSGVRVVRGENADVRRGNGRGGAYLRGGSAFVDARKHRLGVRDPTLQGVPEHAGLQPGRVVAVDRRRAAAGPVLDRVRPMCTDRLPDARGP